MIDGAFAQTSDKVILMRYGCVVKHLHLKSADAVTVYFLLSVALVALRLRFCAYCTEQGCEPNLNLLQLGLLGNPRIAFLVRLFNRRLRQ